MDEKNNDFSPESLSRTERIRAIKNSIHNDQQETASAGNSGFSHNTPESSSAEPDEWEKEIAERIAKRVQQVKANKNGSSACTPESILSELDKAAENREESPQMPEEQEFEEQEFAPQYDGAQQQYPYDENYAAPEYPDKVYPSHAYPEQEYPGEYGNEPAPAEEFEEFSSDLERFSAEEFVQPANGKKSKKKQKKSFKQRVLGLLPNRQDSLGERIRKIVFIGSCAAVVVCGYIVADYYIGNALTQKNYEDIGDIYGPPDDTPPVNLKDDSVYLTPLDGAQRLLDINKEVIGFIRIPDTEVNYPVMQSGDLEKYLNLDINEKEARAGALFLDYRNKFDHVVDGKLVDENSDNLVIYGHNMGSGMMFGSLKNYYENYEYYGKHPIIELNSNYACYKYKIFAMFIVDADDKSETAYDCWNKLDFDDEKDFYKFVNEAKRRTFRLTNVDVKYGDKLLTLSTCHGIFGEDGPGRLIIMARLVRDGEDLYSGTKDSELNPNIKWPSQYYKYNNEKYDPDAPFVPYEEMTAPGSGEKSTNPSEESTSAETAAATAAASGS